MVFHLPWRQTKGCLQSLVEIHGLPLEIPHQTTFSRRAKGLGKVAFHRPRHDRPIHILVDSTGVKVHSGNMRKPVVGSFCGKDKGAVRLEAIRAEYDFNLRPFRAMVGVSEDVGGCSPRAGRGRSIMVARLGSQDAPPTETGWGDVAC